MEFNQVASISNAIYNFSGGAIYLQLSHNQLKRLPETIDGVIEEFFFTLLAANNFIDISVENATNSVAFNEFRGALVLDLASNGIQNISRSFLKNSQNNCVQQGISLSLASNNITFEGLERIIQNNADLGVPLYIDVRDNDITYIGDYTFTTAAHSTTRIRSQGWTPEQSLNCFLVGIELPPSARVHSVEIATRAVDNATTIMYFSSVHINLDNCSLSSVIPPTFDFSGTHIDVLNISARFNDIGNISWLTSSFASFNTGVQFTSNGRNSHRSAQLTLHFACNAISNGVSLARGFDFESSSITATINVSKDQISTIFGCSDNCTERGFMFKGSLDLSENAITTVPANAFAETLQSINISNNHIETLSGAPFSYNFNLVELVINHNNLSFIDTAVIAANRGLRVLQARNNSIIALPTENNNIANVTDIEGNTISCASFGRSITAEDPYSCACKSPYQSLVTYCQYSYCSLFPNGSMCIADECVQRFVENDTCSGGLSSTFQPVCVKKSKQCYFAQYFTVDTEHSGCGTCVKLKNCSNVSSGDHMVQGFESVPNTPSSDRVCLLCTKCGEQQTITQECTATSQTICVAELRKTL